MSEPIQIRFGGYGPATTTHSRTLKAIGDRLTAQLGDAVDVKYLWNIMDFGYRSEDILWLVEKGILTLGYQSSSYFTSRVPELQFADLPFLFRDLEHARAAYEGALGAYFRERIEARMNYRILGYFENGFRHLSNRLRPVHRPQDLAGMRIRVLPSAMQARTFELLGAVPLPWDLTDAIEGVKAGTVDAQENPLSNTVTYGVHKFHRFHTLTGHFFLARPVFINRDAYESWPARLREAIERAVAEAIPPQRDWRQADEAKARAAIEAESCEIVALSQDEREVFVAALLPIHEEARAEFGDTMPRLVREAAGAV